LEEGSGFSVHTPEWKPEFVAEPSQNGGRVATQLSESPARAKPGCSRVYAQELAPLPLQLTTPSRLASPPRMLKGRLQVNDIEPFYYTTFCNELLCHPRILHNCSKHTVAVKVELREIEWKDSFNGYFAHLPECGATIHNNRRGPFLVQNSYTTCSLRNRESEHHFSDEFKIKLPLDLKPRRKDGTSRTLSLFFTVYNVKVSSKSKWKRTKGLFTGSTAEASKDTMRLDPAGKSRLDQIACGFLPISTTSCLVDNGIHDVRVVYKARSPPKELREQCLLPETSLVLVERKESSDLFPGSGKEDSIAEDTTVSYESASERQTTSSEAGMWTDRSMASDVGSTADDSVSRGGRPNSNDEPISLSVRSDIR
jgi:hypothetical protein